MQALKSPLFYLPILLIVAVNSAAMDLGLWLRMSLLGAFGAGLIIWYWKYIPTKVTWVLIGSVGLFLWPLLQYGSVPAMSEWWGHMARMFAIFGLLLGSSAAFSKEKEEAMSAVKLGSQITLLIVVLSILPSLFEAYEANNIYLAKGKLFTHKNYAAATLLLLLPLSLLPGKNEVDWQRYLTYVAVGAGIITMLFLRTRGVWLGAIMMIVVAVVYYALRGRSKALKQSIIAFGILAVGLVGAIGAAGSEKVFNSSTIQTRMHYWNASLEMYLDQPVTGVGAGQWKIFYPSTGLQGTNESVMNGRTSILRPHNDMLWMLSETGIGALFFLLLLVAGFSGSIRAGGELPMALVIVGFTIYGLGEFPLERATLLMPFAVALGYAHHRGKRLIALPQNVVGGVAIFMSLGAAFVGAQKNSGEEKGAEMLQAYGRQNALQLVRTARAAESGWFEMDIYNNPVAYFEGLGQQMQGGERPSRKQLDAALKTLERSRSIHPYHMLTMNQQAQIYRSMGRVKEARDLYKEVVEMSPHNTTALLGLMESERALGNVYGAMDALVLVSPKYNFKNLPGYRAQAIQTLGAFAKSTNPRPATRALHEKLNASPQSKMWQIWTEFREIHHKK